MFCTNCGAELRDGSTFCTNCGTRLAPAEDAPAPTEQIPVMQAAPEREGYNEEPEPPRRSYGRIVAICVIAVLVLAAGGLAAYHFLGPGLPLPGTAAQDAPEVATSDFPEAASEEEEGEAEEGEAEEAEETDPDAPEEDPATEAPVATDDPEVTDEPTAQSPPVFSAATASSTLAADSVASYGAEHLIDGDITTGWSEGVSGTGVGEWFELSADSPQLVSGMRLFAGYHKSSDLFRKNACPTKVRVEFSDGTSEEMSLGDVSFGKEVTLNFARQHETTYVRVYILEVRSGTDFSDTVVSEATVF